MVIPKAPLPSSLVKIGKMWRQFYLRHKMPHISAIILYFKSKISKHSTCMLSHVRVKHPSGITNKVLGAILYPIHLCLSIITQENNVLFWKTDIMICTVICDALLAAADLKMHWMASYHFESTIHINNDCYWRILISKAYIFFNLVTFNEINSKFPSVTKGLYKTIN